PVLRIREHPGKSLAPDFDRHVDDGFPQATRPLHKPVPPSSDWSMTPDTRLSATADAGSSPVFRAPYAPADEAIAAALMRAADGPADAERRIDAQATRLIEGIRAKSGGLGGIEDFLHAYSLSTKEGLALMVLAEALLRVPDAATADQLIEDKLASGDWSSH